MLRSISVKENEISSQSKNHCWPPSKWHVNGYLQLWVKMLLRFSGHIRKTISGFVSWTAAARVSSNSNNLNYSIAQFPENWTCKDRPVYQLLPWKSGGTPDRDSCGSSSFSTFLPLGFLTQIGKFKNAFCYPLAPCLQVSAKVIMQHYPRAGFWFPCNPVATVPG